MKYDLVFEGGGAKGMAFVGACAELLEQGHAFGRLLGTSAGAITATLLAAGYGADEMTAALAEKDDGKSVFAGFMGDPEPFTDEQIEKSATLALLDNIDLGVIPNFIEKGIDVRIARALAKGGRSRHVVSLIERGGWFSAAKFSTWLRAKLDSGPWRGGNRHFSAFTLGELFAETGADLSMVASDTTDRKILVLNHRTAPQCPVVSAVRMSMSIPLVWDEVIWNSAWGEYRDRDITGHAIVDGGMLSNFPLELFLSDDRMVTAVMGPKQDNPVLGLLIDETLEVKAMAAARGMLVTVNVKPAELATIQRLLRLVDTATGAHDNRVIEQYGHLIVRLPAKGYGTTEFDMTEPRRLALVAEARAAVKRHFVPKPAMAPAPGTARGAAPAKPEAADTVARELLAL